MLAVPIEYWRPANHASLHLLGQPCIAYIAAAGKWIAGGIGTCLHLCSVCIFVFQSSLKPYQQVLAGEGRAYRIFYGLSAKKLGLILLRRSLNMAPVEVFEVFRTLILKPRDPIPDNLACMNC